MPTTNPNSAGSQRIPTDDDKLRALNLMYNRLVRGFTPLLWATRVHPMLDGHPQFQTEWRAILFVKNACVESALMSIRDIDDFFRPRSGNSRDSDLRAVDFFGYQSPGPFLSDAERQSINQYLAHLTYHPVWSDKTGIAPDDEPTWNIAEHVQKAASPVFGFMDYLDRELSAKHPEKADDVRRMRRTLENGLREMAALAKRKVQLQ